MAGKLSIVSVWTCITNSCIIPTCGEMSALYTPFKKYVCFISIWVCTVSMFVKYMSTLGIQSRAVTVLIFKHSVGMFLST